MASVFISYRRSDVPHAAARLHEHLARRFGDGVVFRDHEDIPLGSDFARAIFESVSHCDCLLAVIGPGWHDARNAQTQQRRLDDAQDFVRAEIEEALRLHKRVLPVLLQGASMPSPAQLPPTLSKLSLLNALEVRDGSFDDDFKRLLTWVEASGPSSWVRRLVRLARGIADWSILHPLWTTGGLAFSGLTMALLMHFVLLPAAPAATLPAGHVSAEQVRDELTERLQSLHEQMKQPSAPPGLAHEVRLIQDWLAQPDVVAKRRNSQHDAMLVWSQGRAAGAAAGASAQPYDAGVLPPSKNPVAEAQSEYLLGTQAYEGLHLATALGHFRAARQYDPQHLPSLAAALQIHVDLAQPAQAVAEYMQAKTSGAPLTDGDTRVLADIGNNMGIAYRQLNRPGDAERFYKSALVHLDTRPNGEAEDAKKARLQARTMVASNYGALLTHMGEQQRAVELLSVNLQLQIEVLGAGHLDLAQTHLALARALQRAGSVQTPPAPEALAHIQRSLELRHAALPKEHPLIGQALNDSARWHALAATYATKQNDTALSARHWALAESAYLKAREAYVKGKNRLQTSHPNVIAVDNNLADAYRMQGKYALASALYELVMVELLNNYPHESLIVGQVKFNIGLLHFDQEQFERALPFLQEGQRSRQKAHPDATDLTTRGMAEVVVACLRSLKRDLEAERLQQTLAQAPAPSTASK